MDASPKWTITKDYGFFCDVCGWEVGAYEEPHYRSAVTGAHHCTVCHEIGKDWRRAGDSEKE